jgi:hypothetical protein
MKRKLIPIREKQGKAAKRFREGERSAIDLQALQKIQDQFDALIENMMDAKLLLAGLAIGGNEVWTDTTIQDSSEEDETE